MPEADIEGARYQAERAQAAPGFFLKGSHQLDWGMKNRLARIFNPATARTVMLAVDHGYFQGPTTGLERIDISIVPLVPLCRRADDHAWCAAHIHSSGDVQARSAAVERRAKRFEGAFERTGRC